MDRFQQHVCHNIINRYPHIDIWWMQFSLAGYYGNQDHVKALQNAQKLHENHYASYKEIFNPVISIPFASFVYFCREENKELNKYRVPLTTIYENNPGTQVLYKGDEVMFGDSKSRSMKNILKWESHFRETLPMENPKGTVNELKSVITEFANKYGATGSISFELYDSDIPLLVFYPSGESSGGFISIYFDEYIQKIEINSNGNITSQIINY